MGAVDQGQEAGEADTDARERIGKTPRTARGERTLQKILDAALLEFGERGFSDSSIVSITSRANVALGTFYTYFESKDALFQALVRTMSGRVRDHVAPALASARDAIDGERLALQSFLEFAAENAEVYRIIDEAEFVDPQGFRYHYETTAARIRARLDEAADRGELRGDESARAHEIIAWALMGANVFLGLRYAIWAKGEAEEIAGVTSRLLRQGIAAV